MKRHKLKHSSAIIIKRRKKLRFTPIAIQIGTLPKSKEAERE